ncbi:type II toxin-antitoxin system RelE family toxin [Capilliphycus salinus ALCB114379]|uniref:type II toxin-antitoxin system RelE family toxin n=1 Tax=Capilliphycus salinus TaxID=2768948 RepID=UPI0039A59713
MKKKKKKQNSVEQNSVELCFHKYKHQAERACKYYQVIPRYHTPKNLPSAIQEKVNDTINGLSENPKPPQSKKRKGHQNIQEHPIGKSYRLIYEVFQQYKIVVVYWFGHHQEDFHKPKFEEGLRNQQRKWRQKLEP